MFEHTTKYEQNPTGIMLKKAFRSPHPALNVYRRNEDVTCDIEYLDIPAIFDGSTAAVIFLGTSSKVTDVHGIKRDNQFTNTLEDTIIQQGAPITYLVTEARLSLAIKLKISYKRSVLTSGKVNHISTTKILRNNNNRQLRMPLTVFLIILVHPHTYG
jgi:hypothetical protein